MFIRVLSAGLVAAGLMLLSPLASSAAAPPAEAEEGMICHVYQVADLVVPIAGTFAAQRDVRVPAQQSEAAKKSFQEPVGQASSLPGMRQAGSLPHGFATVSKCATDRTHEDRLIQLICSVIAPTSWIANGGRGCIEYYPLTMGLVVRQTRQVQEEVAELLSALRRLQDVEVSVELRFLTIPDDCLEKLGIEESDGGKASISRLDDTQVRLLLEAAQADTRVNIMQAPKLTVFNGQKAVLDVTEKQAFVTGVDMVPAGMRTIPVPRVKNVDTGLKISVLPVVSADNRTVTMQLGVSLTRCDSPQITASPVLIAGRSVMTVCNPHFSTRSFETTLKLSDGTSGLISGWTQHREVRNQTCPPVLSKIPYICRLFNTMSYGKEREHMLVMVTPRIVVQQEKEEALPMPPKSPVPAESGVIGATEQAEEPPPAAPLTTAAEPQPRILYVHRRSFRLDYALENVGPAGVGKLDVWYTRDTKTWSRYEKDVPAKGHATITVPADGRWGFTLIPYSGAGLSSSAPTPGDQPNVWVEVDTMQPQVSIFSASAVKVEGDEMLRVEYRSEDDHLKLHPVTISYATSADGPWTVLSRSQDASDTFTRPLQGLPCEFYVCVEAEDVAGNVGRAVTPLIHADLKIPRVRAVKVNVEE